MWMLPAFADMINIAQDFPGRNSEKFRKYEKGRVESVQKQVVFVEYPQNSLKIGCK